MIKDARGAGWGHCPALVADALGTPACKSIGRFWWRCSVCRSNVVVMAICLTGTPIDPHNDPVQVDKTSLKLTGITPTPALPAAVALYQSVMAGITCA